MPRLLGDRAPVGARDRDVHDRTFHNWDAYFGIVWTAALVFALGARDAGRPAQALSAALLVLLVPWYLLAGRRLLITEAVDDPRSRHYLVGAVSLFVTSAVLVDGVRLAAFALVPQCFMLLRERTAQLVTVALNVVPMAGWALLRRPEADAVYLNAVFAVVTATFSVVLGTWIIRIVAQSEERARLIAELDASREEVARLSAAHGALTERERLSREIHDTLAQGFTSLLMLSQAVRSELERDLPEARRHLDLMADTARQNLAEARALVADGAPADLDGGSLPDALHRLAARQEAAAPVAVTVTGEARPLPAALEVVALRACQEALANARKHAGPAADVAVCLSYDDRLLTLAVRDTGSGFDPGVPHQGYGLSGLRARATEVGGCARVRSRPGGGTTVTVALPLPARSTP